MSSMPRRRAPRAVLACAVLSIAPLSAHAQSWSGAGADSNFTTAANWSGGVAPTNNTGAALNFNNLTNVNQRYAITFNASPFNAQSLTVNSTVAYTFNGSSATSLGVGFPANGGTALTVSGIGGVTFNPQVLVSQNSTVAATGGNITFNSGLSFGNNVSLNASAGRTITVNGQTSLINFNTYLRSIGAGNVVVNAPAFTPGSSTGVFVSAGTMSYSGVAGATGVLPSPTVSGGTLRVLTANAITGPVTLSGGVIELTGSQTFSSSSTITGGRITGTGPMVGSGATLTPGAAGISLEAPLNYGNFTVVGAGANEVVFAAPIVTGFWSTSVTGAANLRFTSPAALNSNSQYSTAFGYTRLAIDGGSPVAPGGLIATNSTSIEISAINGPRTLDARVETGGDLYLNGAINITGGVTVTGTGNTLSVNTATLNNVSLAAGVQLFVSSGSTNTVSGRLDLNGSTNIQGLLVAPNFNVRPGGTVSFNGLGVIAGTVNVSGSLILPYSYFAFNPGVMGQLDLNAPNAIDYTFSDPYPTANVTVLLRVTNSLAGAPGRLNINAPQFVSGRTLVDVSDGVIDNNSTLTLGAGARLTSASFLNDGVLVLGAGGSATFTGAFTNNGAITFGSNATLALGPNSPFNNAIATLEIPVSAKLTGPSSSQLTNNATLILSGGEISGGLPVVNNASGSLSGRGTVNAVVTNFGDVSATGGTLFLNQGMNNSGVVRVSATGTLSTGTSYLNNNGLITGAGSLAAPVNNLSNGRIQAVGGALYLTQPVLSQAGSRLLITPGGTLYMPAGFEAQTNNGLISLSGGTLDTNASRVTNSATGAVNGYGNIITAGFRNSGAITLAGGTTLWEGPLTNDPAKTLRIQAGTGVFTAPVTNNGSIVIASGGAAVFAGGFSGGAPTSGGPGDNAVAGTGSVTLSPSTYAETDGLTQASVTLGAGAQLKVVSREPTGRVEVSGRTAPASLSVLGSLSIASGATFDLTTNDLVLRSADLGTVRSAVASWWAGGARNGTGLASTSASADTFTTLAVFPNVADGATAPFYGGFGSTTLAASDVIVRYAYVGDTNIDGLLDGNDLANLIEGFSAGLTGWQNGDLNYDGVVNTADLSLFTAAYAARATLPPLGGVVSGGGSSGAIPEPATAALLFPAAALLRRKRR